MLPNDRAHAVPAEIGTTFKPIPVTNKLSDVVVEPIKTTESTDSNFEVRVLISLYLYFDLRF